jgi:hypothetical protein
MNQTSFDEINVLLLSSTSIARAFNIYLSEIEKYNPERGSLLL